MLALYNTALLPFRLLAPLWGAWQARDAASRAEWEQRLGRDIPAAHRGGLWIHGSSVGEARIVGALARQLRRAAPRLSLSVSSQTVTGRAQLPGPPEVDSAFFAPLDFPDAVDRTLATLAPRALILVETELWPNLLHAGRRAGLSIVVVNGRLSADRMRRYRRFGSLYRGCVGCLSRVAAQSEDDAARFVEMGLDPSAVEVTGNVKYDLPVPADDSAELRRRIGWSHDQSVFLAGSTAVGEEEILLDALARVREQSPGLRLALAPRHPERFDTVERQIRAAGFSVARFSATPSAGAASADVLLVDTVGDLRRLYRLATVAFVGGSLVPVGGHNLLEPALVEAPLLVGPHTHNVAEMAGLLSEAGASRSVCDAEELAAVLSTLLAQPEQRETMIRAATRVATIHRGALSRSIELIDDVLQLSLAGPTVAS